MKRFVFYFIFGYACYLSWVKLSGNEPQQLTDIHQDTISNSIREAAQTAPRYASKPIEMDAGFHCDGRRLPLRWTPVLQPDDLQSRSRVLQPLLPQHQDGWRQ